MGGYTLDRLQKALREKSCDSDIELEYESGPHYALIFRRAYRVVQEVRARVYDVLRAIDENKIGAIAEDLNQRLDDAPEQRERVRAAGFEQQNAVNAHNALCRIAEALHFNASGATFDGLADAVVERLCESRPEQHPRSQYGVPAPTQTVVMAEPPFGWRRVNEFTYEHRTKLCVMDGGGAWYVVEGPLNLRGVQFPSAVCAMAAALGYALERVEGRNAWRWKRGGASSAFFYGSADEAAYAACEAAAH